MCNFFFFFLISPRWKCDRYRKPLARRFSAILFESFIGRVLLYNLCDCDKKHGRHFARDFLLVTPSLYRIEYLTSTFFFFCFTYKTESLLSKKATTATTTTKWISWLLPFSLSRCVSPIAGGTKRSLKAAPAAEIGLVYSRAPSFPYYRLYPDKSTTSGEFPAHGT